jgi:hypothetical protein
MWRDTYWAKQRHEVLLDRDKGFISPELGSESEVWDGNWNVDPSRASGCDGEDTVLITFLLAKLFGMAGEREEIPNQSKTCSNLNGGHPNVPTDPEPLPFALRQLGLGRRFCSSYTYACRPIDQPTVKHITPCGLRS